MGSGQVRLLLKVCLNCCVSVPETVLGLLEEHGVGPAVEIQAGHKVKAVLLQQLHQIQHQLPKHHHLINYYR